MSDIISVYTNSFQLFFAGMPEDVISLAVTGLALATEVFFFSIPFLIVKYSR